MRRALFGLVPCVLSGAVIAEAKPAHVRGVEPRIDSGDPLPRTATRPAGCTGGVQWIGSGPSTPLALVTKKNDIVEPGRACCAAWSTKGAAYHAVDSFGQLAGDAVIAGGEGYDATQCYELMFQSTKGNLGAGLYFSGRFTPPPSAEWKPTLAEMASLEKTVGELERAMLRTQAGSTCAKRPQSPRISARSIFFRSRLSYTTVGDKPETRWVAVGGPLRIIARLDGAKWTVRSVDARQEHLCNAMTYTPRAAFDMNGDGTVEVILHEDFGDSFGDVVMGLEVGRMDDVWDVMSVGVNGSTA